MDINKLKEVMKIRGFSYDKLARACNVSKTTINNILNGSDFRVSILENMAVALQVTVGDLYSDKDPNVLTVSTGHHNLVSTFSNVGISGRSESEKVEILMNMIESKDKLIEEKEKLLVEKERFIQVLLKSQSK